MLIEVGGIDTTSALEDVGHSDDAREALQPLLIGELAAEEAHEIVETYRPNFEVVTTVSELHKTRHQGSSLGLSTSPASILAMVPEQPSTSSDLHKKDCHPSHSTN